MELIDPNLESLTKIEELEKALKVAKSIRHYESLRRKMLTRKMDLKLRIDNGNYTFENLSVSPRIVVDLFDREIEYQKQQLAKLGYKL